MIICPNPSCQAKNPDDRTVCMTCQTALPHRYLWAVGAALQPGQRLAGRYVAQRATPQIVLDTQPGLSNEVPAELPDFVRPYLFLTRHPVNLPRPYALLPEGTLLLEEAAVLETAPGVAEPMRGLTDAWPRVTPLRQLGWLWQVAQLWQPCSDEQVAGTLLQLPLCRIDGALIKLQEISLDPPGQPAVLAALGEAWSSLVTTAHPSIQDYLQTVCDQLLSGQIQTGEQLVTVLEQGLEIALPQQSVSCDLAMLTDQGPTRQRNEDACYPISGSKSHSQHGPNQPGQPLLFIVCDGIGGHQGGDVASKLALAVVEQKLKSRLASADTVPDPVMISLALEEAICAANDEIAQQNDQEARQARDRMGTTIVLGLVLGPQLYLAHVGDSRAYRISARRCQQVTLDDDVAAREVRLGYGFYRNVVAQPGTGALVQALGMTHSTSLYPNVQRFLLDEDSVFLLCSDGLSDGDRVEQFWTSELLPLLKGKDSPTAVAQSLVHIANNYNGHDNVTVGLLQVKAGQYVPPQPIDPAELAGLPQPLRSQRPKRHRTGTSTTVRSGNTRLAVPATQPTPARRTSVWSVMLGLIALVGVAGGLVTVLFSGSGLRRPVPPATADLPPVSDRPPIPADLPNATAPPSLEPLTYGTVTEEVTLQSSLDPTASDVTDTATVLLPNTLIQVLGKQNTADDTRWVQIRVCGQTETGDRAASSSSSSTGISPEQVLPLGGGWILESRLAAVVQSPNVTPDRCVN